MERPEAPRTPMSKVVFPEPAESPDGTAERPTAPQTTAVDPVTGEETSTDQFQMLRDMLDAAGIAWHDNSDSLFARTQGEHARRRFSAIFGYGSYGYAFGLLEVRMDSGEPIGWLTAPDAMSLIAGDITDEQADHIAQANYDRAKREAI